MNDIYNNLYSYFTSKDIKIVNYSFESIRRISLEDIKMQIRNIVMFQKEFKGYKDNILPRIGSTIGKELEGYKVQVKNLELDLEVINEKLDKNIVDIFLLEEGEKLLSKARLSILDVESSNYIKLIRRSMMNYEVCLGSVTEENLRKGEDFRLEIGTIKYLNYNLFEQDMYSYLKYIKRKNCNVDIEYLIEYFVEESLLDEDSIEYLRGLVSYPFESLKLWDKYRRSKKKLTEQEYIDGFYKAKKIDSNDLIVKGDLFSE